MKHIKFPKLDNKNLIAIKGGINDRPPSCSCSVSGTSKCITGVGGYQNL